MVFVKGGEIEYPPPLPAGSTHISYTLPVSLTEQMLAHCHCSRNDGDTNMPLDNDNVDYIGQTFVCAVPFPQ